MTTVRSATTTAAPAAAPVGLVGRHIRALAECLQSIRPEMDRVAGWGRELALVLGAGGRVLVAGNGGSAAQAQHLTAELVGRYCQDRAGFSAICLSSETSSLTAIANDYGMDELFARQVRAHGRPGDVLVCLSTSGSSRNVLAAAKAARGTGMTVWALTGACPNLLVDSADDAASVAVGTTATVQEVHLVFIHVLCEAFDAAMGFGGEREP